MGKALVTMAWTTSPPPTILTTAPLRCQVRLSRGPVDAQGVKLEGRLDQLAAAWVSLHVLISAGSSRVGGRVVLETSWPLHGSLTPAWKQLGDNPQHRTQAETVGYCQLEFVDF